MPITFACECKREFEVSEKLAGKQVRCPRCDAIMKVPGPSQDYEVIDDPPKGIPGRSKAKPQYEVVDSEPDPPRNSAQKRLEGYGLAQPEKMPRYRKKPDYHDSFEERLYSDSEPPDRRTRPDNTDYHAFGYDKGPLMGIMMIVFGGGWFYLGIKLGWVYYYPAGLIVFGIVAVIRSFFYKSSS